MRDVFKRFDENSDGRISVDEFGKAMRGMGLSPTNAQIQQIIKAVDVDGLLSVPIWNRRNRITSGFGFILGTVCLQRCL